MSKKQSSFKGEIVETADNFWMKHPFVLPVVVFLCLFFIGLTMLVSLGGQTVGASDKRIVQIFYDGKDQTVPTRAKSVGELLQKLSVTIGPKDVVEPSIDTPIVEDNFKVNVYRARAVEIIDGTSATVVQTASTSPKLAAKEAGIELKSEDAAYFERPSEALKGPLVAEKVIIERSVPITVSLYGTISEYRTRAKTLAGFLEEKNIALQPEETSQPANLTSPITEGMFLSINAPGKQITSINEPIPFTTQTKNNPALTAGQTKILQPGQNGLKAVLYDVETKDGIVVNKRLLQSIIITEPVTQIIEKGTLAVATYSVSDDKATLMAAAGIDPSQFASVDYIVQKESNWRPGAINSIGCIGLAQRCPSGGNNALASSCPSWQTDPVCQLRHFSAYANGRYGSWNAAYQVWVVQRWW